MKILINAFLAVGAAAAAITGTTVLVKKNETVGKAYEKHAPKFVKTSATYVETKAIAAKDNVVLRAETLKASYSVGKTPEFQALKDQQNVLVMAAVNAAIAARKK